MTGRVLQRLIESENARNLSRDALVDMFLPTTSFRRLLSHTNHVVIGSRGSGKTALARMLSHDHLVGLSRAGDPLATEIIAERSFIGVYVSTKAEWVGSIKNKPWQTAAEKEAFFCWRLNLATCRSLLRTLRSCFDTFLERPLERHEAEYELARSLSVAWFPDAEPVSSIVSLKRALEDLEWHRGLQMTEQRVTGAVTSPPLGLSFEAELFAPLKRGIVLCKRALDFPERSKWVLCLDEAEFLEEDHHRILNSHLRSDSEDLTFKLTTTPYRHLTLATNTGAPLRVGHDFEYVYIDQEKRTDLEDEQFAKRLFQKLLDRLDTDARIFDLDALLGRSVLLESKPSQWKRDSEMMALLKSHATPALWNRAVRLGESDTERFRNEVVRKIHGLLLLREAIRQDVGHRNLEIYSGAKMLVRCGDGNPRRLLRLMSVLLSGIREEDLQRRRPIIPPSEQTEVMIGFSAAELERTHSEPEVGDKLYEFIERVGTYMRNSFHSGGLSGDVVSAIRIDPPISDEQWAVIRTAVEVGLLFPTISRRNPDNLPLKKGTFHLANVLAPYFRLLPRRGKAVSFAAIVTGGVRRRRSTDEQEQFSMWESSDA